MSDETVSRGHRGFLVGLLVIIILLLVGLAIAQIFTGCWITPSLEMARQPSVGYVEPPRLAAPDEAVPFQGPDVMPGEGVPGNPVVPSTSSEQRGLAGYTVLCVPCHGEPDGDPGPVGQRFDPPPPRLVDRVTGLADGQIYLAVTQGFGRMPALASQSARLARWDIVNYLRGITTGPQEPSAASQVARGAAIYRAQCASCHGTDGEGALGPPLYPSSLLAEASTDEIARFLAVGRPGRGMPSFAGRLDDTQLSDVAVLLKAVQEKGPSVIDDALRELGTTTTLPSTTTTTVPTTTTTPGGTTTTTAPGGTTTTAPGGGVDLAQAAQIYSANCEGCHGVDGSGGIGPRLKPNDFVAGNADAAVKQVIEQGRSGTAMPAWSGRLSPQEVDLLVALLRSWQAPSASGASLAHAAEEATLPYSHRTHVQKGGLQCLFCHAGAALGPAADLPPLALCAGCHRYLTVQTDNTAAVIAAFDEGTEVSWPRIYNAPDFVFFTHRPHVFAGVDCAECHGDVGQMDLASKAVRHTMGFCLECHEKQENAADLIDCDVCHR